MPPRCRLVPAATLRPDPAQPPTLAACTRVHQAPHRCASPLPVHCVGLVATTSAACTASGQRCPAGSPTDSQAAHHSPPPGPAAAAQGVPPPTPAGSAQSQQLPSATWFRSRSRGTYHSNSGRGSGVGSSSSSGPPRRPAPLRLVQLQPLTSHPCATAAAAVLATGPHPPPGPA